MKTAVTVLLSAIIFPIATLAQSPAPAQSPPLAALTTFPIAPPLTEFPRFLPIERFGNANMTRTPTSEKLTAEEEAALKTAYGKLPHMPGYLYSGCHDRAHAIYLMLPVDVRPKLMKIWIVTPAIYTEAISGAIQLKNPDPDYRAVKWNYHVAVAYRDKIGLVKIIDPALAPGREILRGEWFAGMAIPTFSVYTFTDASVYMFFMNDIGKNSEDFTDKFAVNGRLWNGGTFRYEGRSVSEERIPENLARDSVGVDALAGTTCAKIVEVARQPDSLLQILKTPSDDVVKACGPSIDKFSNQRAFWNNLLPLESRGPA